MPRECYSDPETEIPAGRWHATFRQIIRGRRGQRILRELEAILLAVPGHKLAKDQIVTWTGQACLIGEYVIAKRMREDGVDRDSALVDLLLEDYDDWTSMQRSAELGRASGIPWTLAWELAQANDTTVQEIIAPKYVSSPQERWAACLKLVQAWIVEGSRIK